MRIVLRALALLHTAWSGEVARAQIEEILEQR
jgi:hypothetical protein